MNKLAPEPASPLKVGFIGECMIEFQSKGNSEFQQGFAGDTLNSAVYFSRLTKNHATTEYCSAIGRDTFSQSMLNFWIDEGIHTRFVRQIDDRQPGIYLVETDAYGERSFLYWRNQSAARYMFSGSDFDAQWHQLDSLDLIYLSGISIAILNDADREKLLSLLLKAKQGGCQICFDNNFRPQLWESIHEAQTWYSRFLKITDIACLTHDDDMLLWGDIYIEDTLARCRDYRIEEVVIKQGTSPCVIQNRDGRLEVEACVVPPHQIIDTNAAGDSFSAGYLAARVVFGYSPKQSATFAHQVASRVIQHRGAIIPASYLPEIKQTEILAT